MPCNNSFTSPTSQGRSRYENITPDSTSIINSRVMRASFNSPNNEAHELLNQDSESE